MPLDLRIATWMTPTWSPPTWITRQTPRSRFRLAVSLGFVVVASVALMLGVNERSGFADGLFGDVFGGSIFGQQPAQQAAVDPTQRALSYRVARRHAARVSHHDAGTPRPVRLASAPMPLARQSMCVRLCDGFAFPVGAYHGSEDNVSHEATCHSECPGARTALYIAPAGGASMADASDARTGESYSDLPDAFHYTTVLSDACTCHAKSGGRIASLLHDFTLRRGDAVMTRHGFQVFHGAASFPYKRKDFVALARSPDIRDSTRAAYRAIERASLDGTATVARGDETRPDRLLRQASR